jgi:probable HAF family extracellular repeat protein
MWVSPAFAGLATFDPLGFPAPTGGYTFNASRAYAVSGDGSTVVGQSSPYAFRWTETGGMVSLGGLQGGESLAYGVSQDGEVVVGTSNRQAFRWTLSGNTMEAIGPDWTIAYGVSANGQVAVGRGTNSGWQAFSWTQGGGLQWLTDTSLNSAYAASAYGSVVVGRWDSGGGQAFRMEGGVMTGLGGSYANAVSANGSVVIGESNGKAFRWTNATGMTDLGISILGDAAGGDNEALSLDLSADGSVVVGTEWLGGDLTNTKAFIWDEANNKRYIQDLLTSYGLNLTGWSLTHAGGISADGSVVVGRSNSASGTQAFRWVSGEGMSGLGDLLGGNFYSAAYGVSANGSVVVGVSASDLGNEAFRWTEADGMVGLGYGGASAVSADGSVVVGWGNQGGFIWDTVNGRRSLVDVMIQHGLDLTGWEPYYPTGISADGLTIVGYGRHSGVAEAEAWIADLSDPVNPVPVPGAALLGAIGLSFAGWRLRRKTTVTNLWQTSSFGGCVAWLRSPFCIGRVPGAMSTLRCASSHPSLLLSIIVKVSDQILAISQHPFHDTLSISVSQRENAGCAKETSGAKPSLTSKR